MESTKFFVFIESLSDIFEWGTSGLLNILFQGSIIQRKKDRAFLYSYDLNIDPLSLEWFYVFENYLYVLETWKGLIQVHEILGKKWVGLNHLKTIDLSKLIDQIIVNLDFIMINGGDPIFLFDHFGTAN